MAQQTILYGSAIVIRLILIYAFPSLPDLLTGRVEISTPVTSFKRLREGLFLYTHNVSPYDGGVFHQAPLLLSFSLVPPQLVSLLYILVDLLSADALATIAETGASRVTSKRKDATDSVSIAGAYLLNPFTIVTCLGRPTSVFTNCAILYSIRNATTNKPYSSMLALGLASYLSLYPVLLLPPIILLCYDRRGAIFSPLLTFSAALTFLLYLSRIMTGSWEFIPSTYGVQLLLPDLTPNLGLWWYFFIEMFDSFREFFLGVFWLHLASYVPGLSIRLRKQPLFVATTLLGIFAIFKPYPSVSDVSLYLAMLPLYRHIFPLMRYTFFATSTIIYATLLGPAFYHLWIYAGSGNANFFYAITLVWSLGLTVILTDSLFAVLRDEAEGERPELRGKDIRTI